MGRTCTVCLVPALVLLLLTGCGPREVYWAPKNISVTPEWAVLAPGESLEFEGYVSGYIDSRVRSWTATGGTIESITGTSNVITFTAPATPGRYELTAFSNAGNMLATATIVVPSTSHAPSCTDPAATIDIPDPGLADLIRQAIGSASPVLSCADMQLVEVLESWGSNIADLEGIQHARQLRTLDLGFAWLRFIEPLALTPWLTELNLPINVISDLTPLAGFSDLQYLDLYGNHVSDLSPLAGLSDLQHLNLYDNPLTDLSPLAGLVSLRSLDLGRMHGGDLGPIAGLTNLEYLELSDSGVTDLAPLAGLLNLEELYISHNPVADLTPLAGLTSLEYLGLRFVEATDLTPLLDIGGLRGLSLGGVEVPQYLPTIGNLVGIQSLSICCTTATDLAPLANLTSLQSLEISSADVTDIGPLAGLTALTELNLGDNRLVDVGAIESLTNLNTLTLQSNYLTAIDPLVANSGLGEGDVVDVTFNCLDGVELSSVTTLEQRGVSVDSEPQRDPCPVPPS